MLSVTTRGPIRRRELLRIGALGLGGLTLPNLMRHGKASSLAATGRAKSAILLFLSGWSRTYGYVGPEAGCAGGDPVCLCRSPRAYREPW